MSILDTEIATLTMGSLIWLSLMWAYKLLLDKKYGVKFPNDLQYLDHALDTGTDMLLLKQPRFAALRKMWAKEETKNKYTDAEAVNASETIPTINKMNDDIANLQNDFGIMLPLFNKEIEHFKEEIEKFVDSAKCPPELKDKCIEYFLEIKKVINGNVG